MQHQTKNFPVHNFKVLDQAQGIIEAIVSVFDVVDYAKERVKPGFFTKSLANKLPKGVWMHQWDVPVAKTLIAEELTPGDNRLPEKIRDKGGLYIKGQFNLNTQRGKEAFSDLDFGTVDEFSFGYDVTKSNMAADGVKDLIEGTIYEWSPVLVGCNPATALIGVKSLGAHVKELQTKGEMLGDVETAMAMASVRQLDYALWDVIYNLFYYRPDEGSLDEKLATLEGCFNEYRDTALKVIRAIMSGDADQDAEEAAVATKSHLETLAAGLESGLPAGTLSARAKTALAAAQRFAADLKSLNGLRAKDGRTISASNHERLSGVHEAMKTACGDMESFLGETDPNKDEKALQERKQLALQLQADALRIEAEVLATS